MVNLITAQKSLLKWVMKKAGVTPHTINLEEGTTINIWLPRLLKIRTKGAAADHRSEIRILSPQKPAVVLLHGFAADGIVTWQLQVASLSKDYALYIPDLVFFGGSTTERNDRTIEFQAECMLNSLKKIGVEKCTVVGFSYGGLVAVKMAAIEPGMVRSVVLTGSTLELTPSFEVSALSGLGFSSASDLLLPTSVEAQKALLSVAAYKKLWFPNRLHRDFLQVMFEKRKEKKEMLDAATGGEENAALVLEQHVYLLWGEEDRIFKVETAHRMKD